ncbi:hypothetical protein J6590_062787 [Homalodisca vitripennis]|nr:hypothetical protein J6590_062787 [Homalodisca vitripennis]
MEDCLGLYKRISRSQLVSSDKDGRLPRIVQTDIPFTLVSSDRDGRLPRIVQTDIPFTVGFQ